MSVLLYKVVRRTPKDWKYWSAFWFYSNLPEYAL